MLLYGRKSPTGGKRPRGHRTPLSGGRTPVSGGRAHGPSTGRWSGSARRAPSPEAVGPPSHRLRPLLSARRLRPAPVRHAHRGGCHPDASPQQVALARPLRRSATTALIPGASSVAHLRENIAAADLVLPDDAVAEPDAVGR
ncbi:MAG TPA: aldo/keto reductase [Streptomyces sp.]|uniref:aldo/keto reductase n=1 Tax=Streptomyces sp. TaxID=1931 RepID=UPI002D69E2F8|nr:aldo/keto reductase [Streptomyces sp.]HZG02685.1 aldo/keto reductase [Streptomyces sp.]